MIRNLKSECIISSMPIFNEEKHGVDMKVLEIDIKLHINEQLYKKGHITNEMYTKAKDLIVQSK